MDNDALWITQQPLGYWVSTEKSTHFINWACLEAFCPVLLFDLSLSSAWLSSYHSSQEQTRMTDWHISVKIATGKALLVSQYGFDCDRSLLTMHFAFHCKEQIASYFKKISGLPYLPYPLRDLCHYF